MKNFNQACLAAGLFIAVLGFDVSAMDESLKRKESALKEHELPDFKKRKLLEIKDGYFQDINKSFKKIEFKCELVKKLDAKIEYLESIKKFPIVHDPHTEIPWAPLAPEHLVTTSQFEENVAEDYVKDVRLSECLRNALSSTYECDRFTIACLLLAGADVNYRYMPNYNDFLCDIVSRSDYWLVYVSLLCGANPDASNRSYKFPIQFARTVEMAELLINCGACLICRNLLLPVVNYGNWRLLKFYLDKGVAWRVVGESPFSVLMNFPFSSPNFYSIRKALKTLKLLFLARYRDKDDEVLRESICQWVKWLNDERVLLLNALKDPTFSLDLYLYKLDRNKSNALWNEQIKMYAFGINNNQTDMKIRYL